MKHRMTHNKAIEFAKRFFQDGGSSWVFAQKMGCHCDNGACPFFTPSGSTPGNASQCAKLNSSGQYGCPVTQVDEE